MDTAQWIQILFSGALVLATGVLAYLTYRYMKATRRMAELMEMQTKIMTREFEDKVAPLIDAKDSYLITTNESGKYNFQVVNCGKKPVILKEIRTRVWHKDKPEEILYPHHKEFNKTILPKPDFTHEFEVEIPFNQINKSYPAPSAKKEIIRESVLIFEDINKKEFEIKIDQLPLIS